MEEREVGEGVMRRLVERKGYQRRGKAHGERGGDGVG